MQTGPRSSVVAAALALLALTVASHQAAAADALPTTQTDKPNIILIVIDALRADRLTAYGHRGELCPTLDAIAAESVLFERALAAAPWTAPSVASLFCSVYPGVHGTFGFGRDVNGPTHEPARGVALAAAFDTLAERLTRAGYETAAFSANPFVQAKYGYAQGFAHFDDSYADNSTPGDVVNKALLRWLQERDARRPFFVYAHYMDVHGPYNAEYRFLEPLLAAVEKQPGKRRMSRKAFDHLTYLYKQADWYGDRERHAALLPFVEYWVARYEAGVRQMDYHLTNLRDELKARGEWDSTYLIVLADHGEALGEHDLWDHGWSLYDTDLHVPLLLRWPGHLTPQRVHDTVGLIDVMPTLLEQLHLPIDDEWQGRSLLGAFTGDHVLPSRPAFAEGPKNGHEQKAIYVDPWKLVMLVGTPQRQFRLFLRTTDPDEMRDLAGQGFAAEDKLRALLEQQMQRNAERATNAGESTVTLDADERARLQALGYVLDQPTTQPAPPP